MQRMVALGLALLAGCTTVTTVQVPGPVGGRELFCLSGDLKQPYDSMGLIQVTRRGVLAFGFADPAGTDLNAGFNDLFPQIRAMGGDGIINLHYQETQYPLPTRMLFAVLFFIPLPTEVTLTGEVVRLRRIVPPSEGAPSL